MDGKPEKTYTKEELNKATEISEIIRFNRLARVGAWAMAAVNAFALMGRLVAHDPLAWAEVLWITVGALGIDRFAASLTKKQKRKATELGLSQIV